MAFLDGDNFCKAFAGALKGALSIGKGQIYLVLYEYYVGSYQANIS